MLLILPVSAYASANRTIDLEPNRAGRPVMPISINGQETKAILDTGATIAMIDQRLLADPTMPATSDQTLIVGIGGRRAYPLTTIDEVQIGSDRWLGLRAAINDETGFPTTRTILPVNMFSTRVVDFDFYNQRIHLYNHSPRRLRGASRSRIKYEEIGELLYIPIRINGVKGRAMIDTGADMSFITPRYAALAKGRLDEEQTKIIRGSDLYNNTASVYRFRRLRVGSHELTRFTMPVLDTEFFTLIGFEDEPMMVIGIDLLEQFRVQLDREEEVLTLNHLPKKQRRQRYSSQKSDIALTAQ